MTDLVAKVAEHRAVRLVQILAIALSHDIVRLFKIDDDKSIVMLRDHRLVWQRDFEFEGESGGAVFGFVDDGQAKLT